MILRANDPSAFALPGVLDILHKAPISQNPTSQKAYIRRLTILNRPEEAIFFAYGPSHRPSGVAIVRLPNAPIEHLPYWHVLYCPNAPKLRKELLAAGVKFIKDAGYNGFIAVNSTGHTDKAFERMCNIGTTKTIGTVLEFDLGRTNH